MVSTLKCQTVLCIPEDTDINTYGSPSTPISPLSINWRRTLPPLSPMLSSTLAVNSEEEYAKCSKLLSINETEIDSDMSDSNSASDSDELDADSVCSLTLSNDELDDAQTDLFDPKCIRNDSDTDSRVQFDTFSVNKENGKICALSSHGLDSGCATWYIELLRCDDAITANRIEIGAIGTDQISDIATSDDGIAATAEFGSRTIYGCDVASDTNDAFYASLNENGSARCFKPLKGWAFGAGDTVKVGLDLQKSKVKFWRNDEKVRKTLSLEPKRVFYPCICFSGHCQFAISNVAE